MGRRRIQIRIDENTKIVSIGIVWIEDQDLINDCKSLLAAHPGKEFVCILNERGDGIPSLSHRSGRSGAEAASNNAAVNSTAANL